MHHTEDSRTTLIDEIGSVQQTLEMISRCIDTLPLGDSRFGPCLTGITTELDRLFTLERDFLYPVVREHVAHGAAVAERGLQDQDRVRGLLAALEGLGPGDEDFHGRLDALVQAVRCHMVNHEEHLFPRVRASVPARRLTVTR